MSVIDELTVQLERCEEAIRFTESQLEDLRFLRDAYQVIINDMEVRVEAEPESESEAKPPPAPEETIVPAAPKGPPATAQVHPVDAAVMSAEAAKIKTKINLTVPYPSMSDPERKAWRTLHLGRIGRLFRLESAQNVADMLGIPRGSVHHFKNQIAEEIKE